MGRKRFGANLDAPRAGAGIEIAPTERRTALMQTTPLVQGRELKFTGNTVERVIGVAPLVQGRELK